MMERQHMDHLRLANLKHDHKLQEFVQYCNLEKPTALCVRQNNVRT